MRKSRRSRRKRRPRFDNKRRLLLARAPICFASLLERSFHNLTLSFLSHLALVSWIHHRGLSPISTLPVHIAPTVTFVKFPSLFLLVGGFARFVHSTTPLAKGRAPLLIWLRTFSALANGRWSCQGPLAGLQELHRPKQALLIRWPTRFF